MPLVDIVFWIIFIGGFIITKKSNKRSSQYIFQWVAILMFVHFSLQTAQGFVIEWQEKKKYDQIELAASFIPAHFQVIGKTGNTIEITERTLFSQAKKLDTFISADHVDLTTLFQKKPKAKV